MDTRIPKGVRAWRSWLAVLLALVASALVVFLTFPRKVQDFLPERGEVVSLWSLELEGFPPGEGVLVRAAGGTTLSIRRSWDPQGKLPPGLLLLPAGESATVSDLPPQYGPARPPGKGVPLAPGALRLTKGRVRASERRLTLSPASPFRASQLRALLESPDLAARVALLENRSLDDSSYMAPEQALNPSIWRVDLYPCGKSLLAQVWIRWEHSEEERRMARSSLPAVEGRRFLCEWDAGGLHALPSSGSFTFPPPEGDFVEAWKSLDGDEVDAWLRGARR